MSLAYLTPKGQVVKGDGRDVLSTQNVNYNISNIRLDSEGQLEEFTINNAVVTDLENSYIYVDDTNYLVEEHKKKGKTGYLKKSYFIKLKNSPNKTYYEINDPEKIAILWFDNHFEAAQEGDIFHIEKVLFNKKLDKYYQYLRQSFKIKTDNSIDYTNYLTYPVDNILDEQSPDYNKREILEVDRLIVTNGNYFEEGNFFETNILKIRQSALSDDKKISLYKKLTSICFAIYWIRKEVLDIVAIKPIADIENAVNNGTIFSQNSQQEYAFSEIDRVIGQLLIDWGFKNYISTKELYPTSSNNNFYDGYDEVFSNYKLALDNFYHNLRVKDEEGLFPDNDSESRIMVLKDILPSSAWSLFPFSFRRNIIDSYITENSLKGENETQCLRIIHSFYLVPTDGEDFLNYLLRKRDGSVTNFERLFRLFNDKTISQVSPVVGFFAQEKTNRRNFVFAIYEIWKRSKYDFRYFPVNTTPTDDGVNPDAFFLTGEGKNYYKPDGDGKYFTTLEFGTIDLLPQYPGDSPGIGTKEFIDTSFYVDEALQQEKVHITKVISHNFNSVNQNGSYLGLGPEGYQDKEQMYLHLYQPINLISYKPEEDLKDFVPQDPIIPAFVYYYFNEYDRVKDINAAWSLGIDITIEVVFFFISGGTSVIKDLRYLHYVTDIGKAFRVETAAEEAVLILRATEIGGEVFTLTSSMCWSASQYIETSSNNAQTKETARKVARVFFFLTMLGAGATIYARKQATRAAREVLRDVNYNSLPKKVKDVVIHLTGVEDAAIATFRSTINNLDPNTKNLYNGFVALSEDLQKIFLKEFEKATQAQLRLMNDFPNSVNNWKNLFTKSIDDRIIVDVIVKQSKIDAIVKYYSVPALRDILKPLSFKERWLFLDEFGDVDIAVFNELKKKPIGINALLDAKTLPKNSIDMFDVDDMLAIIRAELPTEHHLGCLMYKNRLEWFKSIKSYTVNINCEFITSIQLKSLYNNFSDFFAGVPIKIYNKFKSRNRLFVKVECYQNNNLVEPATLENYLSGYKNEVDEIFQAVPNLKSHFVEPDDYDKFTEFARNAFDNHGKERFNDTEVKFLYNFFTEHYHKGNRFEIQMESILYTCKSCQKYLQAAKDYARSQEKVIDFKFISHHEAKDMEITKKLIK